MGKEEKKKFVWKSLRISFWIMVGLGVLFMILPYIISSSSFNRVWSFLSIIWVISVLFTFVISIIHLTKYKEKGLAVTSLVISSLFVLIFLILFLMGIMVELSGGIN